MKLIERLTRVQAGWQFDHENRHYNRAVAGTVVAGLGLAAVISGAGMELVSNGREGYQLYASGVIEGWLGLAFAAHQKDQIPQIQETVSAAETTEQTFDA
jgi:hypothetical protein